jgi:hypothetical protein
MTLRRFIIPLLGILMMFSAESGVVWWFWHQTTATTDRAFAIGLPAGICLAGAIVAWLLGRWSVDGNLLPANRVATGLMTVGLRLATPLAALAWFSVASYPRGSESGLAARVLVTSYLILLWVDILLTVVVRGGRPHPGDLRLTDGMSKATCDQRHPTEHS